METTHLLRRKFSAGHAHQACGDRPHGHDFEVIAVFREGYATTTEGVLAAAIAEIDRRSLAEMLPGIPSTCAGIANWLFERLRFECPVVRVSVWQSGELGAEVTETEI
jgi:6-pyruvoyl-tetrahydropterin synthase